MSPISRSAERTITPGALVRLHFSVHLESGEEVDTTRRGSPAELVIGDGNLPPGFEAVLLGMRRGDDARITLEAEDAFGPHRQENVQIIHRDKFGEDMVLEEGLMVSFSAPGGELPGVVRRIMDGTVEVDFNHPLAGRRIVFDVSIVSVGDGSTR
jgi:FKBP-type peptidyl-prolyl cis-trans isomerase SlpA